MTQTKQQLLREIESLPESLATEALDFIAFIKARHEHRNVSTHEQASEGQDISAEIPGGSVTSSFNPSFNPLTVDPVPQPVPGIVEQELVQAILAGKYAHLPNSSDDFARRKQEEIDWEDRNR